jgi:hypothetical protein
MAECATPEQILKDPHAGEFEKAASAMFQPAMATVMEMIEAAGYVPGAIVRSGAHEYRIERVDISASSVSAYHGYIAYFTVLGRRRLKNGWGWALREQVISEWGDLGDLKLTAIA